MSWPLYHRGNTPPHTRYALCRRLGGPQRRSGRLGEEKILDPTGTRTPTPPQSSQSLYRLHYFGSSVSNSTLYSHFTVLFTTRFGRTRSSSGIYHYAKTAALRGVTILLHVHPLLVNGLVNTFPQKQTRGIIECLLLGNEAVNTDP
jgi:hypothetical protein